MRTGWSINVDPGISMPANVVSTLPLPLVLTLTCWCKWIRIVWYQHWSRTSITRDEPGKWKCLKNNHQCIHMGSHVRSKSIPNIEMTKQRNQWVSFNKLLKLLRVRCRGWLSALDATWGPNICLILLYYIRTNFWQLPRQIHPCVLRCTWQTTKQTRVVCVVICPRWGWSEKIFKI